MKLSKIKRNVFFRGARDGAVPASCFSIKRVSQRVSLITTFSQPLKHTPEIGSWPILVFYNIVSFGNWWCTQLFFCYSKQLSSKDICRATTIELQIMTLI